MGKNKISSEKSKNGETRKFKDVAQVQFTRLHQDLWICREYFEAKWGPKVSKKGKTFLISALF